MDFLFLGFVCKRRKVTSTFWSRYAHKKFLFMFSWCTVFSGLRILNEKQVPRDVNFTLKSSNFYDDMASCYAAIKADKIFRVTSNVDSRANGLAIVIDIQVFFYSFKLLFDVWLPSFLQSLWFTYIVSLWNIKRNSLSQSRTKIYYSRLLPDIKCNELLEIIC